MPQHNEQSHEHEGAPENVSGEVEYEPSDTGLPRAQIKVYSLNSAYSALRVQGEYIEGEHQGEVVTQCIETARDTQKSMNDAVMAVADCLNNAMLDGVIDGYFLPEGVTGPSAQSAHDTQDTQDTEDQDNG